MPRHCRLYLLALYVGLGACAQQLPPSTLRQAPVTASGPQCNESAARFAVGQLADAKLAEEARIRAGAQRVRMVRPGQMVTMEYDPGRLTLDIDASGRVSGVRCG
jgi:hypothetical protein